MKTHTNHTFSTLPSLPRFSSLEYSLVWTLMFCVAILVFSTLSSVVFADYIVSGTETYDSSQMTGVVTLSDNATLNCDSQTVESSVTSSIVVASDTAATISGSTPTINSPISVDGAITLSVTSNSYINGNITGNGKVSVSLDNHDTGPRITSIQGTNSFKGGMSLRTWYGRVFIYGDQSEATGGYTIGALNVNAMGRVFLKSGAKATGPLEVLGNIAYDSYLDIESNASYTITDPSQGVLLEQGTNGSSDRPGSWVRVSGTMSNAGTLTMVNAAGITVRDGGKWTQNGKITMTNNYYHGITLNVEKGGLFTYTGTDPIVINPHSRTETAAATTVINIAGTFETSAGFKVGVNSISGTSRATINLNGGTIKAGADIDNLIMGVNTGSAATLPNLKVNSASTIDTNGHNVTINTYGNSDTFTGSGTLTKSGTGTLTLVGVDSLSGGINIIAGTLKLTGNSTLGTGKTTISSDANLELNVADGQTRQLTWENSASNTITGSGRIVKSGNGDLKILTASAGQVVAEEFVVSSGRLDMKGFYDGNLEVECGAIFSPGNSVGELTIAANGEIAAGTLTMKTGSTLLWEIGTSANDALNIADGNTYFEEGSVLSFVLDSTNTKQYSPNEIVTVQLPKGIQYKSNGSESWNTISDEQMGSLINSYYFQFNNYNPTSGIMTVHVNPNAVPEPSTWALLILGCAGLMWYRKRERR